MKPSVIMRIGASAGKSFSFSNKLTAGGNDTHKELLNLILGKTEIAKAEILSVIESADNFDVKCEKIDKIADAAKEYFDSVLAQII